MDINYQSLTVAREEVAGLVREIMDMLDEILDAEAACHFQWDAIAGDGVANRLATLTFSLRDLLTAEEACDLLILANSFGFTDELIRLREDHLVLLDELDRVFALTGSPLRGAFSWTDIERSFRSFVASLADHDAREEDVWQRLEQAPLGHIPVST